MRIILREECHLLFIDVTSTCQLWPIEEELLQEAKQTAQELQPDHAILAALADTPYGAQALAHEHTEFSCPKGQEREHLSSLPISRLYDFTGLQDTPSSTEVGRFITFFSKMGVHSFAQAAHIELLCEYSDHIYSFSLHPVAPCRDVDLFVEMAQHKLAATD